MSEQDRCKALCLGDWSDEVPRLASWGWWGRQAKLKRFQLLALSCGIDPDAVQWWTDTSIRGFTVHNRRTLELFSNGARVICPPLVYTSRFIKLRGQFANSDPSRPEREVWDEELDVERFVLWAIGQGWELPHGCPWGPVATAERPAGTQPVPSRAEGSEIPTSTCSCTERPADTGDVAMPAAAAAKSPADTGAAAARAVGEVWISGSAPIEDEFARLFGDKKDIRTIKDYAKRVGVEICPGKHRGELMKVRLGDIPRLVNLANDIRRAANLREAANAVKARAALQTEAASHHSPGSVFDVTEVPKK